ncbi:spore germination protein [Paratissierella segnis]|uniref:Spore germination protein n=1 Tax=Paratissierella segnis TaxID=2763679 RepID=A0A926IGB3_9FIRM|nr:spore germination protein [Paratissierella segnis]MBC8589407.1 spore germination protein [Paratissierella segnis]
MISKTIEENKDKVIKLFNNTSDLIIYEFEILSEEKAMVAYFNGIIDRIILNEDLLKPLKQDLISPWDVRSTVYISPIVEITKFEDIILPISSGCVILFIEGLNFAYNINLAKWSKRQVEKPTTEVVIRGPKESFVEDIVVNRTLIRRKIKNNNLVFEDYVIGEQTNTSVSVAYMVGIVRPEVLDEVRDKIKKIKVDKILDSGNIESYLIDKPKSLISSIAYSEKPDIVVSKILEGSVAILCDGSPNVLTVPNLFIECLHSAEDYYIRPHLATFLRVIRLISLFMSITLPGIYVSLVLFHQEMVPTELLISIAGQREGVPLSSPLEALLMILFFELLKESSIRLPQAVGEAVTLIGGLVIGTAAVEAGVVSAFMIILISATGMAEFVNPKLRELISISRLIFLLLGTIAGLYGVTLGLLVGATNMVSLKSFGTPYMWPYAPYNKEGMKDSIIKTQIKKLNFRPKVISNKDSMKRNERIE